MTTETIKIYAFSELSKAAKEVVYKNKVNNMIDFESSDHYENWPDFAKAVKESKESELPFLPFYVHKYCGEDIYNALMVDTACIYTESGDYFKY
jgi:hypothetical protein